MLGMCQDFTLENSSPSLQTRKKIHNLTELMYVTPDFLCIFPLLSLIHI